LRLLTKFKVATIKLDHKIKAAGLIYLENDAALAASYGVKTRTYAISVRNTIPIENNKTNKNKGLLFIILLFEDLFENIKNKTIMIKDRIIAVLLEN
tara:strand:+ start:230 stop:520 length:291 start_codon:yes stop_codon:yes gene_type:complete